MIPKSHTSRDESSHDLVCPCSLQVSVFGVPHGLPRRRCKRRQPKKGESRMVHACLDMTRPCDRSRCWRRSTSPLRRRWRTDTERLTSYSAPLSSRVQGRLSVGRQLTYASTHKEMKAYRTNRAFCGPYTRYMVSIQVIGTGEM